MDEQRRQTVVGAVALGVLLLTVAQLVPWATESAAARGFGGEVTMDAKYHAWGAKVGSAVSGWGGGSSSAESRSWYSGDLEGDGVAWLRAAFPLLLAGIAAGAAAAVLAALGSLRHGALAAFGGGAVTGAGLVSFMIGLSGFTDGAEWSLGLFLGLASVALLLAGGVLLLGADREAGAGAPPPSGAA